METCDNCNRTIGRLETGYLWRESVVCKACHDLLHDAAHKQYAQISASTSTHGGKRFASVRYMVWGIVVLLVALIGLAAADVEIGPAGFVLVILISVALSVLVLAMPYMIATQRHHPQRVAIGVLGALGGIFTGGLLWIIAIVWAYTNTQQR